MRIQLLFASRRLLIQCILIGLDLACLKGLITLQRIIKARHPARIGVSGSGYVRARMRGLVEFFRELRYALCIFPDW